MRADGGGVHAGDEGGSAGGADAGDGKRVQKQRPLAGKTIDDRGLRFSVAVAAQIGADVLDGDPEDVGPLRRAEYRGRKHAQRDDNGNQ